MIVIFLSCLVCCGIEPIIKWIRELIESVAFKIGLIINSLKGQITLAAFEPKGLLSLQSSISFLSITILNIILPVNKEKVLGLTYHDIFFKWKIFKYFNAADCILYSILMLISNIILAVVSTIFDNPYIKNISNLSFIIILFASVILAFYMLHMSLIAKFKKSRIYYLIYEQIEKNNKELYNSILEKIVWNSSETEQEKVNYDYYIDEIKILIKMMDKKENLFEEDRVADNLSSRISKYCPEVGIIRLKKENVNIILKKEIEKRQNKIKSRVNSVEEILKEKGIDINF